MITVIELIKLSRFKSRNIQCWPLPGTVGSASNLFPELFFLCYHVHPRQMAFSKNVWRRQKYNNLYRALRFSLCKYHNSEALKGIAAGGWCINLPLSSITF